MREDAGRSNAHSGRDASGSPLRKGNRNMKQAPLALAVMAGILSATPPAIAGGFIEDGTASLNLRNFFIDQNVHNANAPGIDEWGQGFVLKYQSGFTQGPVGFGIDLLGLYGLRLDGGGRAGKDGLSRQPGSVFPLDGDGNAKHGFGRIEPTVKIRTSRTQLRVGNLMPKLPILTYGDSRLLPQTFRGVEITSNEIDHLTLIAGRLTRVTERNASDHQGMSISGANDSETGRFSHQFRYAGADYRASRNLLLRYYYGTLENFYQQHFFGLVHDWQLPTGVLQTDLRYFLSTSDGKNASVAGRAEGYLSSGYYGNGVTSGKVDNRLWSAMLTYALEGHSVRAGYQQINGSSDFPHINEGNGRSLHLITNAQIGRFASAGERTWLAGYGYDFSALGIPGLKFNAAYYNAHHIHAQEHSHREWERDLRLDYLVQNGPLKGVGVTWRNGIQRGNDTKDKSENRLILSYNIRLF